MVWHDWQLDVFHIIHSHFSLDIFTFEHSSPSHIIDGWNACMMTVGILNDTIIMVHSLYHTCAAFVMFYWF